MAMLPDATPELSSDGNNNVAAEADRGRSKEILNPFLKHDGKNESAVECVKGHALKLFVSPVGKPCAICKKQMPNGDRAWRCFPCDFHMCIDCHELGGKYDKRRKSLDRAGFHNPCWDGTAMDPFGDLETKAITSLKFLLITYLTERYGATLQIVKCETVVPDYSNRGHTGLSLEHVHKIAQSMAKGFRWRGPTKNDDDHAGFDIPVVVQETTQTEGGQNALNNWATVVKQAASLSGEAGFPEPNIALFRKSSDLPLFCSLGNGHFFQALNLFRLSKPSLFQSASSTAIAGNGESFDFVSKYEMDERKNPFLAQAVQKGVPTLILKNNITLKERTDLCELLNKLSDYRWWVTEDNVVDLDSLKQVDVKQSQFELMSKAMDGTELNCLVRLDVGMAGAGTGTNRVGT